VRQRAIIKEVLKFRGVSRLISQEVHEQAADIFPALP
jgi:hypothetical protein